mgnify:CR=1 FL=1
MLKGRDFPIPFSFRVSQSGKSKVGKSPAAADRNVKGCHAYLIHIPEWAGGIHESRGDSRKAFSWMSNHGFIAFAFSIFVRASWGTLRKPYTILVNPNVFGVGIPPGRILVILATFTKIGETREIS